MIDVELLLNLQFQDNGMLKWLIQQNQQQMQLEMEKLSLFQKDLIKYTSIGWKTFKIGVFQDNYGGGIEYLYSTVMIVII